MKVKYQHEHLPDGMVVHLTGLNADLINNQEVEIGDDVISEFEQRHEKKFEDILKGKEFGGPGRPKPETETTDETTNEDKPFWETTTEVEQ